jgi:predicted nucleic acid-binding protein
LIVVDASVLANALTDDGPLGQVARAELAQDVHWSGPEHLLVEAFSAVRGRLLGGRIAQERARDAADALAEASIELLPTAPLLRRMWELRDNLSAYDAAYVAAAEAHECALLTSDGRLAQALRLRCEVRLAVPA